MSDMDKHFIEHKLSNLDELKDLMKKNSVYIKSLDNGEFLPIHLTNGKIGVLMIMFNKYYLAEIKELEDPKVVYTLNVITSEDK